MSGPVHISEAIDSLRREIERLRALHERDHGETEKLRRDVDALKSRPEPEAQVLDVRGAAAFLGVSVKTIQRRIKDGRMPCFRLGNDENGRVRIIKADLLKAARAGFPKRGTPRLHSRRHAPGRPSTVKGVLDA